MKKKIMKPKHKDLRVWHIPQVPGKPLLVPVKNLVEAKKVLDILADYDQFQFDNNIKGDYANVAGLEIWDKNNVAETEDGWVDWDSIDGENIDEITMEAAEAGVKWGGEV